MKIIKYILLVLGCFLIIIGTMLYRNNKKSNYILNGKWLEQSGSILIIKNNKFYWYKDYNNLKDNYYKGIIKYKVLDEYNYDKNYIQKKYGDINPKLFYIIKVYPSKLVINKKNKDISNKYQLLFELALESNKKEGILYSKNLIKTYEIIKYGN